MLPIIRISRAERKSGSFGFAQGSALSIGLMAVPLEYGRNFGHVLKWFVFALKFKFWSVSSLLHGRPAIGYNTAINLPSQSQSCAALEDRRSCVAGELHRLV